MFELSRDEIGSYSVDVNGLSGSFVVEGKVPNPPELPNQSDQPEPSELPNPPEQPNPPKLPTPTQSPTPPSLPASEGINWLPIVGILAAVVILSLASYIFMLKRRVM